MPARFPDSTVDYCVANLLEPPQSRLREPFDLVVAAGLVQVGFDDFVDDEQPPTRRFRVIYRRT